MKLEDIQKLKTAFDPEKHELWVRFSGDLGDGHKSNHITPDNTPLESLLASEYYLKDIPPKELTAEVFDFPECDHEVFKATTSDYGILFFHDGKTIPVTPLTDDGEPIYRGFEPNKEIECPNFMERREYQTIKQFERLFEKDTLLRWVYNDGSKMPVLKIKECTEEYFYCETNTPRSISLADHNGKWMIHIGKANMIKAPVSSINLYTGVLEIQLNGEQMELLEFTAGEIAIDLSRSKGIRLKK